MQLEIHPQFRQAMASSKGVINVQRCTSYLWYAYFSTGIQKVLHIPPTLGHAEFGLEDKYSNLLSYT